ncbi:MAG: HAD family hydrolase [Lachnospiraceae bacterium]|nr:HAD family hydrolase [Lachnospiraceae bacterium]MDE7002083.1 HAD family hydrolase [Lachnospiraceae bacterium]
MKGGSVKKKKSLVLFTDCGDTIVDESTQQYSDQQPGIVTRADFIEDAGEVLQGLYDAGYRIALVADGEEASFENIFAENGLRGCFEAWVVSETVGKQKPEPVMFQTAMDAMGLSDADKRRIVMIGNNLKKDVAGGNRFGLTTVWLDWSPRYFHTFEQEDWKPDHTIQHPSQLPGLLEKLEEELQEYGEGAEQ